MAHPSEAARPRRGICFWLRRGALGLVILLVFLAVAGFVFQLIASAIDRHDFPPPGRLVDIGGFRLHIHCMGDAVPGRPAVILESGLASPSPVWIRVQSEVAGSTLVCAYDRAGIGWSERSAQPRDSVHIAGELHRLLAKAGVAAPYVLVGHSSGGLYVRAYQRLYPRDVSGMVLIDSTPERYHVNTKAVQAEYRTTQFLFAVLPALAQLGLVRISPTCTAGIPADFPDLQAGQYRALCSAAASWSVEADEFRRLDDPLPHGSGAPLSIPLAVLTAGRSVKENPAWGPLQDRIAALSTNKVHLVVGKASHASFLVDGNDAHLSAVEILKVVNAAASGRRLGTGQGT